MPRSFSYIKRDYLGNYPVYCFKEAIISKEVSVRNINKYYIKDYVPCVGYGYLYSDKLLIVDFNNLVIHKISNSIYSKTISLEYRNIFEMLEIGKLINIGYMLIDVYGRLLDIYDIEELIECIKDYPRTSITLEYKKPLTIKDKLKSKSSENKMFDVKIIDRNIEDFFKTIYINGCCEGEEFYVKDFNEEMEIYSTCNQEGVHPLIIAQDVLKQSLEETLMPDFYNKWISDDNIYSISNEILLTMSLLYKAESLKLNRLFTYYIDDIKYVTHIGKLETKIANYLLDLSDTSVDLLVDLIFASVSDEEYAEFIIEKISMITDDYFHEVY